MNRGRYIRLAIGALIYLLICCLAVLGLLAAKGWSHWETARPWIVYIQLPIPAAVLLALVLSTLAYRSRQTKL